MENCHKETHVEHPHSPMILKSDCNANDVSTHYLGSENLVLICWASKILAPLCFLDQNQGGLGRQ